MESILTAPTLGNKYQDRLAALGSSVEERRYRRQERILYPLDRTEWGALLLEKLAQISASKHDLQMKLIRR